MRNSMAILMTMVLCVGGAWAEDLTLKLTGKEGPGKGKHVVLVSGDEEYRSEEALPQLAAILAEHHGFDATVVFAINPDGNYIDPTYTRNIPGLEALDTADLMIIFTRFRDLPDDQMEHIDKYLRAGKPVIGIRTSTHAFNAPANSRWAHYGNGYGGENKAWQDGFGRLVLGEHWVAHHGEHKHESTRGLIAPGAETNPILRGLKSGDVWGSSDVYTVRLPLPGDSAPLILGQVMKRKGDFTPSDLHFGMRPDDSEVVEGAKNNPLMPVAWTKTYQVPEGTPGKAFASTVGAASDLAISGTRRLLINAAYWCAGLADAIPAEGCNVDLVGTYAPTKYEFRTAGFWKDFARTPASLRAALSK